MATIKDVAKLAGVGVGTASRVIAGKGPVSADAISRVTKAVAQLQYRPSHAARSLQKGHSKMIGVFIPVVSGSFYTPILNAIFVALHAHHCHMVVNFGLGIHGERQEALAGAEFLLDRGCDGLLMMGTGLTPADAERVARLQPRLVLLNRTIARFEGQCFNPDHHAAGALAARTLCEAGHRRLAVIEGPEGSRDNALRMQGFYATLPAYGVDANAVPRVHGTFTPQSGQAGVQELLHGQERFTALFCANDEMAIGAISHLSQIGLAVPEDVSVMGYDNIELSAVTAPPLTTVLIPWREIATNAVYRLLDLCYGWRIPVQREIVTHVIWRDSVRRIEPRR
jgi:LacI family transcriptional regulator